MTDQTDNDEDFTSVPNSNNSVAKKAKNPTGKRSFQMKNGVIDSDKIFLFVKRSTIPKSELKRYIELCDMCIQSLGPETLNDSDIEEIALIYRDRIYMDLAYESFAEANAIDTAMVNQIEKINKSLEVRKTNLGARFIDRDKTRKQEGSSSFLDLFTHFLEEKEILLNRAKEMDKIINNNKEEFTKLDDYMDNKIKNKSSLEEDS